VGSVAEGVEDGVQETQTCMGDDVKGVDAVLPLCGRCYEEGKTFPSNCEEKPELLLGQPLGMYHDGDCGAMVIAGMPHPELCERCTLRQHPGFDEPVEVE
jgi:hypothetical protein